MKWADNMLIISCLNSRNSQNTVIELYVLACRAKICHGLFFVIHRDLVLNCAYFKCFRSRSLTLTLKTITPSLSHTYTPELAAILGSVGY